MRRYSVMIRDMDGRVYRIRSGLRFFTAVDLMKKYTDAWIEEEVYA